MSREPDDELVHSFWRWFEQVAPGLAAKVDDSDTLAELDRRISEFGDLAWEVGPGITAAHMLAISPDGDAELLEVTGTIVAMAPDVPGWEFYSARQPRPLTEFSIECADGKSVQVDPRNWRYVLFRFPDGVFDMVVEVADLVGATDAERYTAAVIFVDAVLGEGVRLRLIRDIEPVSTMTSDLAKKANAASHLAAHLSSLSAANTRTS